MLVYRLEDKEGYGPFSSSKKWPDYSNLYHSRALHNQFGCTLPFRIRYGDDSEKYRFGTDSIKKLDEYFGGALEFFLKEGWVVAEYKVRKNYVAFSRIGIEVAFKIEKAERLNK